MQFAVNIIRRAAVPFQPTRKAFSTNSECSSVCWNSQKMKNWCCQRHHGYQLEKKTLPKLQSNFLIADGDTWRFTEPKRMPSGGEGQIPHSSCVKSPNLIRSLHKNTKWQRLGGELWGQRELLWVAVMDTHGIWGQGGQAREIQVRDIIKTRKYNEKDSEAKWKAIIICKHLYFCMRSQGTGSWCWNVCSVANKNSGLLANTPQEEPCGDCSKIWLSFIFALMVIYYFELLPKKPLSSFLFLRWLLE